MARLAEVVTLYGADGRPYRPQPGEVGFSGTGYSGTWFDDEFNTELLAETGVDTWDEVRRDPIVAAGLLALKLPLVSADWHVEPVSDAKTGASRDEQDIADAVNDVLFERLSPDWPAFIREALTSLDFGFSIFESVWRLDGDRVVLDRLAPRTQKSIQQWHLDGPRLAAVRQWGPRAKWDPDSLTSSPAWQNVTITGDRLVPITHDREGDNYAGVSACRGAFGPWKIKSKVLMRALAIGAEREYVGLPIAWLRGGGPDIKRDQETQLATLLRNLRLHQNAYAIMPPVVERLEWVHGATSAVRSNILEDLRYCDEQILTSFLAQFLGLGSTETGSRSVGEVHERMFFQALGAVAAEVVAAFNDVRGGLIKRIVDANFGARPKYPGLVAAGIRAKNLTEFFESFGAAVAGGGLLPTAKDEETIRDMLGLAPRPKKAPAVAPPPPAAPAPAPDSGRTPEVGARETHASDRRRAGESWKPWRELRGAEKFVGFAEINDGLDAAIESVETEARRGREAAVKAFLAALSRAADNGAEPADAIEIAVPVSVRADIAASVRDELDAVADLSRRELRRELKRQGLGEIIRERREGERALRGPGLFARLSRAAGLRLQDEGAESEAEKRRRAKTAAKSADSILDAESDLFAESIVSEVERVGRSESARSIGAGLGAAALDATVGSRLAQLGEKSIATTARGAVNSVFQANRNAEIRRAASAGADVRAVEYSAMLDGNTCDPCHDLDGESFAFGSDEEDRTRPPYRDCEGYPMCRCLHVYVLTEEQEASVEGVPGTEE